MFCGKNKILRITDAGPRISYGPGSDQWVQKPRETCTQSMKTSDDLATTSIEAAPTMGGRDEKDEQVTIA